MADFKAKPTFIEWKRSYENKKFGSTIHTFNMTVELANGTLEEGIFTTTKQDQNKFTVGEEVQLKTSVVTEDHEPTTKFDKVNTDGAGSGGSGNSGYSSKKDPTKDRSIVANVSLECANRIIIHMGQAEFIKPDIAGIKTMADKFYKYIMDKSGGDTQKSITIQAQLKIVTEYFHLYPQLEITTSDQVLKYVDEMVDYVFNKAKG